MSVGGKSEISKSMEYARTTCNVFVGGFANDNKTCRRTSTKSANAWAKLSSATTSHWGPSSCPEDECNAAWNKWLTGIEEQFWTIASVITGHYKVSWGKEWQSHFHVEGADGTQGKELLIDSAGRDRRKYSQVAFKMQMEDDSSAFTVAPSKHLSEYERDGCSEKTPPAQDTCIRALTSTPSGTPL